ncbi:MAG: flagellar motor protein [Proteobacteria bacterium]|jgi:chemotaxis protein MotA|nr:flagellar motor protein [Pseudomonadota bacterium]
MDVTTIIGLIIGIGGILLGNILEGGHLGSLFQFAALVIVLSGTFGAVLVSSKKKDFLLGLRMAKTAFKKNDERQAKALMAEILECAKIARKESILAIEGRIPSMKDEFLQSAMRTIVDGVDPQVARQLFEKHIEVQEDKLLSAAKVWTDAGGYAPTIGIIGAVLGLIHVMGNLTDTSKLGAGIAVAFVATIYGVAFSNLIFLPMGNKLKRRIADEIRVREMVLEGALSIQAGLSPALIDIKLRSFLEDPQ